VRPRAKAKVRQQRREAQKKLETDSGPIEIRESTSKQIGRTKTIDTSELKNVVAATVQRVYVEQFGVDVNYVNARERYADRIVKILKYGYFDKDGYLRLDGGIKMVDHNFNTIPRCRKCYRGD
jgi:hypothetical protein